MSKQTDSPPALLTVDEVADYLGFGRARVWQMIAAGQIPSIKIGHARRVLGSDLADFIAGIRSGQVDGASLASSQEDAKEATK